jgi:predicted RNA-binding Zn-ribbon protein involved in translation (DUF1610 family)
MSSGYEGKKMCPCIVCGTQVEVTKFATPDKVKCPACKGKSSNKSVNTIHVVKSSEDNDIPDDKKMCPCIKCHTPVLVTKFATPDKVLCTKCRDQHIHIKDIFKMDGLSAANYSFETLGAMRNAFIIPEIISETKLREVACPKCGKVMSILKILDSSLWGVVVTYQCPGCNLLMTLSTQTKIRLRPLREHEMITYNGQEIEAMMTSTTGTQVHNALQYMMDLCRVNGVEIPSMADLPPMTNIDLNKQYGLTSADIDLMRKLLELYNTHKIVVEEELLV